MGRLVKNRELDNGALTVKIPSVTTEQRPSGANGDLIYNTSIPSFQVYQNGWANVSSGNSVPAPITQDTFTGDGSTLQFTMSFSVTDAQDILVFIGGVYQIPDTSYSVSGTTLTFGSAPPADDGDNDHIVTVLHGFDSVAS